MNAKKKLIGCRMTSPFDMGTELDRWVTLLDPNKNSVLKDFNPNLPNPDSIHQILNILKLLDDDSAHTEAFIELENRWQQSLKPMG